MEHLHRRQFLRAAASIGPAAWLSTSCGSSTSTAAPTTSVPSTANVLGAMFPRGEPYVTSGVTNRLPFVVAGSDGAPLDRLAGDLTFRVRQGDQDMGSIPATVRGAGLAKPFVAVEWAPPAAGFYELTATYDGVDLTPVAIQVFDPDEPTFPQLDAPLTIVTTPTVSGPAGVDPICTADPPCPLHAVDLAAQRTTGRPVAVLVSTPAFCQTQACGPVLELIVAATARRPYIDAIHVEVYANPNQVDSIAQATIAPAVEAWGFTFEPTLMVVDAGGVLVRRLDLIFDGDEIAAALDAVS